MNPSGRHIYADATLGTYPGDAAILDACEAAIRHSRMNVVSCTVKKFEPQGTTAVWILAESHFTLHTFPEHQYVSADCYTCGDEGDPQAAIDHFLASIDTVAASQGSLRRGLPPRP